jgi:hypothetical protein|uniref:Uncharacterized protein n=1 Tax=Oryza sativa TaxID=4530 RepID=Q9XFE9_ORYSA|nr:unknown [Oryza sativa]
MFFFWNLHLVSANYVRCILPMLLPYATGASYPPTATAALLKFESYGVISADF